MASLEESRRQLEETRSGMEGGMLEGERGGGGGGGAAGGSVEREIGRRCYDRIPRGADAQGNLCPFIHATLILPACDMARLCVPPGSSPAP